MLLVILYVNFGSDKWGKKNTFFVSLFIYFRFVDLYHKPDRISNGCWLFLRPCGIKISPFFLDLVWKGHLPTDVMQHYQIIWQCSVGEICRAVTFFCLLFSLASLWNAFSSRSQTLLAPQILRSLILMFIKLFKSILNTLSVIKSIIFIVKVQ